jgi:hypothetical protein
MNMLEVAYQIRLYGEYLVGNENLGWAFIPPPYDDYIASIEAYTTPQELATSILNIYNSLLGGTPHAAAVIDMTQVGALASATNSFALALNNSLASYQSQITSARSSAQKFDGNGSYVIDDNDPYIDLYDFADKANQQVSDLDVQTSAQTVMTTLNSAIVAEHHVSGSFSQALYYYNLENSHGLSS